MMMQYSTILLIILLVILIVIVLKKITLNFEMRKYFDGANNINFQLQGLRYEGFKSNTDNFFGEKLDIRKTNKYNKVFSNSKYSVWEPKQTDNYLPIGHIITKVNRKPKHFSVLVNKNQTIKPDKFNIISISNDNFGIWQPVSSNEDYVPLGNIYSKEYPSKYSVRMVNRKFVVKSDISKMVFSNKVTPNDKGYELWSIKDSDCFTCNNKNNINEFDSLKNIYTLNNNLLDVKKKLYVKYTLSYKKITQYNDKQLDKVFSIWRPIPPKNFCSLGDIILSKNVDPNNLLQTLVVHESFCKYPMNYGLNPVITFKNKKSDYSVWKPTPPDNHIFLGQIVQKGKDEPISENLLACIPTDYLNIENRETHTLVWNNVNEENPKSLWVNNLNLVNGNSKYVPPESNGISINMELTTSDVDLLDNSRSILLNFKKNSKNMKPLNQVYVKNMVRNTISRKFDLGEERIRVEKFDDNKETLTLTILSRSIDKNSILVEEVVSQIEKVLNIGEIKVYNEDKSDFIITLVDGGVITENMNEILIDNTDYKLSFD
jgi:hypothetical protein